MSGCVEGLSVLASKDPPQSFTVHKEIWDLMAVMRLVRGRHSGRMSMPV